MTSIARHGARKSGLQRQVLSLYADCLRSARQLPSASQVPAVLFVRGEFRKAASTVDKLDIQRIEFLLRQGKKKSKSYTMAGVTAFDFTQLGTGPTDDGGASSAALIVGQHKLVGLPTKDVGT
jgi:succinate dehydrogenase assembly factor 1